MQTGTKSNKNLPNREKKSNQKKNNQQNKTQEIKIKNRNSNDLPFHLQIQKKEKLKKPINFLLHRLELKSINDKWNLQLNPRES